MRVIIVRKKAVAAALVAAIMMLLSVFTGAFYVGQSRSAAFRWLRPIGAWLIGGFAVMFVSTVAAVFAKNNILAVDAYSAKVIFWIFAVLGVEFITNLIIEFYRPRTLREVRCFCRSTKRSGQNRWKCPANAGREARKNCAKRATTSACRHCS